MWYKIIRSVMRGVLRTAVHFTSILFG